MFSAKSFRRLCLPVLLLGALWLGAPARAAEKVIIDADIGDDLDDAFALSLALSSPEIDLLGVTTAWGDTDLRARLVDRMLCEADRSEIPVAAGTHTKDSTPFTQARWASAMPDHTYPAATDFILQQIKLYPGQITLVELAPQSNLAAIIARDPASFRKLKRVVMMGGSIMRGYNDLGYTKSHGPDAEYNILSDIPAARAVLASGVPLVMMPLDSTQIKLDEVRRSLLFAAGNDLTDALTLLYHQWRQNNVWGQETPTLFDVMPVAYVITPEICPVTPMRIKVDDKGFTRVEAGVPNAAVCLNSDPDQVVSLLMQRLLAQKRHESCKAE